MANGSPMSSREQKSFSDVPTNNELMSIMEGSKKCSKPFIPMQKNDFLDASIFF